MAKVKKQAAKVVKKKWVTLTAPEFNNTKLGETYVTETKDALGKAITINMMQLTMDPKKQNLSASFICDKLDENSVACRLISYEMSPVSMRKIVRRNRTKVPDSFVTQTQDKKTIRVKPIIVTRGHASKAVCTELRKQARAMIAVSLRKLTFAQFTQEVVARKLQKRLQDVLKKIHPLSVCEIRAFTLIEGKETPVEKAAEEPKQTEPAEA